MDNGVRLWFTREHIVRYIEKLETELAEWRNRLTLLGADAAISNQNTGQAVAAAPLKPGR
jgi:hypothetical protein